MASSQVTILAIFENDKSNNSLQNQLKLDMSEKYGQIIEKELKIIKKGVTAFLCQICASQTPPSIHPSTIPDIIRMTLLQNVRKMVKNQSTFRRACNAFCDFIQLDISFKAQKEIKKHHMALESIAKNFEFGITNRFGMGTAALNAEMAKLLPETVKFYGFIRLNYGLVVNRTPAHRRGTKIDASDIPFDAEIRVCNADDIYNGNQNSPCQSLKELKEQIETAMGKTQIFEALKADEEAHQRVVGFLGERASDPEYRAIKLALKKLHALLLYARIYRTLLDLLLNSDEKDDSFSFVKHWLESMTLQLETKFNAEKYRFGHYSEPEHVKQFCMFQLKPHLEKLDILMGSKKIMKK